MKNKLRFLDKWLGWYLCNFLWICATALIVFELANAIAIPIFCVLAILAALVYSFWIGELEVKIRSSKPECFKKFEPKKDLVNLVELKTHTDPVLFAEELSRQVYNKICQLKFGVEDNAAKVSLETESLGFDISNIAFLGKFTEETRLLVEDILKKLLDNVERVDIWALGGPITFVKVFVKTDTNNIEKHPEEIR